MNWDVRLVSTDFDGTIFDQHADAPVASEFQDLIAEFQADGGFWVINTGRDQASLLEELARCRVRVMPDFLVVVEREIFRREHGKFCPHIEWNSLCSRRHADLARNLADEFPAIVSWIRAHTSASVFADDYSPLAVVASTNEEMDAIDARLADLATVRPEVTWMRNDVYARLCHSDYSKGTALLEIQRLLGLTPEVVFTVGDHLNDLSMLAPEVARYFAVPKNAVTPVIEHVEKLEGRVSEYSFGLAVANELARLRCG